MHSRCKFIGRCACVLPSMLAASAAWPQACPQASGPDIVEGAIQSVSSYQNDGEIDAFSLGNYACNVGSQNLLWSANSVNHPVTAQHMYRFNVVDGAGRFEQIGLSWVKHAFTALADSLCCNCNGQGGAVLGAGCADIYTSGLNGLQLSTVAGLGPRFEVNAHSGAFVWPYTFRNNNGSVPVTSITRRLQVRVQDLDPALNAGAQYFVEIHHVTPDDASAHNQDNNASYRQVLIAGSGPDFTAALMGQVTRAKPAIDKWQQLEPGVLQSVVVTPELPNAGGDTSGKVIVASKATEVGDGVWNYEYAVYNMNSHRSIKSLAIAVPGGAVPVSVEFHDVFYHSGDGFNSTPENQVTFDGTDWESSISAAEIRWDMVPADPYENSNALRWGTLYNFRFRAMAPPKNGLATLGLYRAAAGLPDSVQGAVVVPDLDCNGNNTADSSDILQGFSMDLNGNGVPDECECLADVNADGLVGLDDVLEVLAAWGRCTGCAADVNGDGTVNFDDILACIAAWGGC